MRCYSLSDLYAGNLTIGILMLATFLLCWSFLATRDGARKAIRRYFIESLVVASGYAFCITHPTYQAWSYVVFALFMANAIRYRISWKNAFG